MKNLLYDTVFDQVPDVVLVLNRQGEIMFFNQVAKRLQHLAKIPLKEGLPLRDIVPLERKNLVDYILSEVKEKGQSQTSEAEYKDDMGRSYFFEITYSPILDDHNDLEQICVMCREITHQKTFEKRVVELVQELSSLTENAKAIIFSIDSRAYITEWNKECSRTTGYDKNEILAQKINKLINEPYQLNFDTLSAKVLGGEAISNQEIMIRTKNGGMLTVLVNATPKLNSSKNVIGIMFVGQDITELISYRHSLEEKVRDRTEQLKLALEKEKELVDIKNRFISVASHEFKVPLSAISTSINYIKTNKNLRLEDQKKLKSIDKQVTYMKSLLDDVLSLKKAEANALKANYKDVHLVSFIKKLMEEVLDNAGHSHRIVTRFSSEDIIFQSDEKLLRNILVNILSNAVKFSPGKEEVYLSVLSDRNSIEIKLRDQGIGIPENEIQKIFEPFNRASNAENIKGTGLGMSIVKKAVETLGGTLKLDSSQEGTSVTVTFRILNTTNQ